jgi:hypothetical protein
MTTPDAQQPQPKHREHECVCAVLAVGGIEGDKTPCDFSGCKHDTRHLPHTPAPEPCIMIEGIDGEMVNLLADDKEIYLDSFARFAKNPVVDMLIQMFRDKQQSLRTTAAQEPHP